MLWVVPRVRSQCCFCSPSTASAQPKSAPLMAERRCRTSPGRSSSSASGAPRFLLPLGTLSCMSCRSCHACLRFLAIGSRIISSLPYSPSWLRATDHRCVLDMELEACHPASSVSARCGMGIPAPSLAHAHADPPGPYVAPTCGA